MQRVILVLLVMAILPSSEASEECIAAGDYPYWTGMVDTPGSASDVAFAGHYAYVADGESGLQVMDISLPDAPELVGAVDTPGNASDVAIAQNYAYVVGSSGLQVIDISVPESPELVGGVDIAGGAADVAITGTNAYVVGETGLLVIDISVPESPAIVGDVDMPGGGYLKLAVAESYAYVSNSNYFDGFRLHVIDISLPESPVLVGVLDLPRYVSDVAVAGNHVYIASTYCFYYPPCHYGLYVVDIADAANPQLVGSMELPHASGIAVAGNYAYVVGGISTHKSSSLQVFDISLPESPALVGAVYGSGEGGYWGIDVSGNRAYVRDMKDGDSVLQLIDISVLESPGFVWGVDTPGDAHDVAVVGNHAYVADGNEGLQVVDISLPESPVLVGSDMSGDAYDVAVAGNYAYVLGSSGLRVMDISVPESPGFVWGGDTPGDAHDVAVVGNYAYVADGDEGLQVIDISDPVSPAFVGAIDFWRSVYSVAVIGHRACVLTGSNLAVIDISLPESPAYVGGVQIRGDADGVAVAGDYAYVTFHNKNDTGLEVIDISAEQPVSVGRVGTFPGGHVAVAGNYAYILGRSSVQVIDISLPESPAHASAYVRGIDHGSSLAVAGNYVYVADLESGLRIAPLLCDDSAQEVTIDIKPGNDSNSINCRGNSGLIPVAVLTTDTFDALTIDHTTVRFGPGEAAEVHVRKKPNPHGNGQSTTQPDSGTPKRHEEDVDGDGDLDLVFHFARAETGIICGDMEVGLTGQTYDGQSIFGSDTIQTVGEDDVEPEPAAMVQISPNPFNPATSIEFVVAEPKHVKVRVYDVRGQLVAELADGAYPVGRHQLEWHGRDRSGRTVSSGLYFFKVDMGGQVEVRKALLIK